MAISLLSSRLKEKTSSGFGPEDPDWIQFVADHKMYLRSKSKLVQFKPLDLVRYKYRPIEFAESQNIDPQHTWILLLVNDLRDYADFNESIASLWVISSDEVKRLRRLYESSAQRRAAVSAS